MQYYKSHGLSYSLFRQRKPTILSILTLSLPAVHGKRVILISFQF